MSKEDQVKKIIEDYLYTRDDILDLDEVSGIAEELAKRLVVL